MPKTMELPNSTRIVLGCCIEMYTALCLSRKPFVPSFIEMHLVSSLVLEIVKGSLH
jgi:hypothetical protein